VDEEIAREREEKRRDGGEDEALMFIGGGCISPNERLRTIPENSARAAYAMVGQHLLIPEMQLTESLASKPAILRFCGWRDTSQSCS
jgi:hypothetical protein